MREIPYIRRSPGPRRHSTWSVFSYIRRLLQSQSCQSQDSPAQVKGHTLIYPKARNSPCDQRMPKRQRQIILFKGKEPIAIYAPKHSKISEVPVQTAKIVFAKRIRYFAVRNAICTGRNIMCLTQRARRYWRKNLYPVVIYGVFASIFSHTI